MALYTHTGPHRLRALLRELAAAGVVVTDWRYGRDTADLRALALRNVIRPTWNADREALPPDALQLAVPDHVDPATVRAVLAAHDTAKADTDETQAAEDRKTLADFEAIATPTGQQIAAAVKAQLRLRRRGE